MMLCVFSMAGCRDSGWCDLTGDKMAVVESGGGSGRGATEAVVEEADVIATEAVRSERDRSLVAVRHVKVAYLVARLALTDFTESLKGAAQKPAQNISMAISNFFHP